jgi:crotonobetainyl-CoA:carnitine CoA-transferase CaiB-like acyl-CoA transferase
MIAHTLPKVDCPAHLSIFEAADGRWMQLVGAFTKSRTVQKQLESMGLARLAGTRVTRANRDEWVPVFRSRSCQHWLDDLWAEDIACMPVLEPGEVFQLEQTRANGYAIEFENSHNGTTITQAGHPLHVDPPAAIPNAARPDTISLSTAAELWKDEVVSAVDRKPGSVLPLTGLRVLDFGSYVAGPLAAQCLADFGADVIKIEPPQGEKGRTINQFTGCHRGKRSVALDLRHPCAGAILERLVASAAVVTHNVRPAAARKLGIDDESLRRINPQLVIGASTAYGPSGPWVDLPAFDPTALALSGAEPLISGPAGRPSFLRNSSMDVQAGLALVVATLLGLYWRESTGLASSVGSSLLGVAAMVSSETQLIDGQPQPVAQVDRDQCGVSWSSRISPALDGWVAVDAATDLHRRRLLDALRCVAPEQIAAAISSLNVDEVITRLRAANLQCERVVEDGRDAFFDRELACATGLVTRMVRSPYGWFENPGGYWTGPGGVVRNAGGLPGIGEHTSEVLAELGFTIERISELRQQGVIRTPTLIADGREARPDTTSTSD